MDDVKILDEWFGGLDVCSRLPPEWTTPVVNRLVYCGTQDGWRFDNSREIEPCDRDPERRHYVYLA